MAKKKRPALDKPVETGSTEGKVQRKEREARAAAKPTASQTFDRLCQRVKWLYPLQVDGLECCHCYGGFAIQIKNLDETPREFRLRGSHRGDCPMYPHASVDIDVTDIITEGIEKCQLPTQRI